MPPYIIGRDQLSKLTAAVVDAVNNPAHFAI